jgi:hypothetical protein
MTVGDRRREHPVPVGIEAREDSRDPRPVSLGEPPRRDETVIAVRLPRVDRDRSLETPHRLIEAPGLLEDPPEERVSQRVRPVTRNQLFKLCHGFLVTILYILGFGLAKTT